MERSFYWSDLKSGSYVFLIALPLCLGISMASGCPPVAGLFTAIIGGILCSFIGSSRLTIKGPAAGLIVIVLGAVQELGQGDAMLGYRRALAIGAAAAVVQVIFSVLKAGSLGTKIPKHVVHGMLAAIGVIIIAKQIHILFGVAPVSKTPLQLLAEVPHSALVENPFVAALGAITIVGLILFPKIPALRKVPAALLSLLIVVGLGLHWHLDETHKSLFWASSYDLGPQFLVSVPSSFLSSVTSPDWGVLRDVLAWKHVMLFALVGTIESMLTVSAVDSLDPLKRKSNLDRDLLATGIGNFISACVGGLPMISEIVRSKANIDNEAKGVSSNFFHGVLLLAAVTLVPSLIHEIPLSALAAMLVVTGFRLASPKEFIHAYQDGWEAFTVFCTTLVLTVSVDLLVGVVCGVLMKLVLQAVSQATAKEKA